MFRWNVSLPSGNRVIFEHDLSSVMAKLGISWVVPQSPSHTYKILESFTAVEATAPPAPG